MDPEPGMYTGRFSKRFFPGKAFLLSGQVDKNKKPFRPKSPDSGDFTDFDPFLRPKTGNPFKSQGFPSQPDLVDKRKFLGKYFLLLSEDLTDNRKDLC